jgi:pimeloyl-ACP methyl ester carboxylesterase
MKASGTFLMFALCAAINSPPVMAQSFELVRFATEDGGNVEAALFPASDSKVVIFAHGAIFDKESWYFLTETFQGKGVSALAIDFRGYGNSKAGNSSNKMYDVLAAISWLKEQGFTDINVVGGSMGGAAILRALNDNSIPIQKAVLLAPGGGPAIESTETDKLFVVAKNEGSYSTVRGIYKDSSKPKQIKVYPGDTHAQHLFKTDVRDELIERIVDFIIRD